jgi:hypothetical protein
MILQEILKELIGQRGYIILQSRFIEMQIKSGRMKE